MTINERIKQIRQTLGLTQSGFADRIAVSASFLAAMERGDKNVNDRILRLISMEFGISEHWIRTAITEAMFKGTARNVVSEGDESKNETAE